MDIAPQSKNLIPKNNTWTGTQTYSFKNLGTTPDRKIQFLNTTAALTGAQQVSPGRIIGGQGFKTSGTPGSQPVEFLEYVLPIQGLTSPRAAYKLQKSINNAAFSDLVDIYTTNPDGNSDSLMKFFGTKELNFSQSNQDPSTSPGFLLTNVSGSYTNTTYKFGSTIKAAITVGNDGAVTFKSVSSSGYFFSLGGSISSQNYVVEIYSGGIYCNQNGFFQGNVTAGSADLTPPARLTSYGSVAKKVVRVITSTYSFGDESTVLGDASGAAVCAGTHNACSIYTGSGESVCNSHSTAGCSWFSGNSCGEFNGNQGGCEGQSPCVYEQSSCSGANNTDQTTCENQDDSYGGSCSWDTSTCPAQSDQSSCESNSCTWNFSDCHNFDTQSQSNCEVNSGCAWVGGDCHSFDNTSEGTCTGSHTGCSWTAGAFDCHTLDGSDEGTCEAVSGCQWNDGNNTCFNLCDGTYDEGSVCNGQYNTSCTGNLCNGSFNTGNCTGNYGALCQGTALCSNFSNMSACNAEGEGCAWTTGAIYTLPSSTSINKGNTSRYYEGKNIGASANISIVASSPDTMESAITLTPGDKFKVQHYTITEDCSGFGSQSPCEAQSPCVWNPAIVCADYNGNQSECEAHSGNSCVWNSGDSTCSGAGSTANCSGGSYIASRKWYRLK